MTMSENQLINIATPLSTKLKFANSSNLQSGWFAQTFPRIMKSLFLEYPRESSDCEKPGNSGMAMLTIVMRRSMV